MDELEIKELKAPEADFHYDVNLISRLRQSCTDCGIIGQPRALSALKMGMSIRTKGYNIYVSGEDGTGRHSAIRQIYSTLDTKCHDIVYAYNFAKPQSPILLLVESSKGAWLVNEFNEISVLIQNEGIESALNKLQQIRENPELPGNQAVHSYLFQAAKALTLGKDLKPEMFMLNLASDSSTMGFCNLIEEFNPTHSNIFGQLSSNTSEPVHLRLTAGSILEAAGGFFVVRIEQILAKEGLWDSLKLFAESSSFTITSESPSGDLNIRPVTPDIPVKIILIGSDEQYDKLCDNDEQFLRLFKLSAEFDFSMPASEENISGCISYLTRFCEKNGLLPISDSGIAQALLYSSWYAEMRGELTTKLSFLGDLLQEANYLAGQTGLLRIDDSCIRKAMDERDFANGLTEEHIDREIETGEMIISLEGTKTGVVNGLAIMDRGLSSFGTPTVISVSVAPGSEGIVNIEHEAGLSGEIHDKGLLILEGYLRRQYARTFPLSIYAGICFEQSYAEVDGDSASSSELFALLSAIGELPVRQDVAVTGSVNQLGDIQPVGGINEKISGFFTICERMGLTGRQGVIIPKQNVKSLILPEKIVKAIEMRKFHIWPISTIDQGMEILTLRPSGARNSKGTFPMNTINRIIEDRLKKLYELSKPAS